MVNAAEHQIRPVIHRTFPPDDGPRTLTELPAGDLRQAKADRVTAAGGERGEHRIRPVVHRTFPLQDGPRALAELASGDQFGKLVLTVPPTPATR
ncbi:zinc-binding dehydrogenase [Amycolatopsis tucumanensis]|uniref:Zinc-binding dehydrogenase n=1 Tax=Amycolatopsis tucumanensis TaxID=401106 RepID=A0ABP7J9F4_9PSEU|nr:zinc-binding dehydrogenase [Amycolatopsis tucumanensis]